MKLTVLASGSTGNCALVESNGTKLLIDAGISARKIQRKLELMNVDPSSLNGIILTHEHGDHVCGLGTFRDKFRIPLFCNTGTAVAAQVGTFSEIKTGARFKIGNIEVECFSVPHDAIDPLGYILHDEGQCLGIITDLGTITKSVLERLQRVDSLLIESNYDEKLLQMDERRPYSVKMRTLSRHGHLSNNEAGEAIASLCGHNLKDVTLCHLSRDCNNPELAMNAVLERTGALRSIVVAEPE